MEETLSFEDWTGLMARLGFAPAPDVFRQLQFAYGEAHRAYHTGAHVAACLAHLSTHQDMAKRPDEIRLALWFHDAIYDPFAQDNERKSADWAVRFCKENGATDEFCARIDRLIMVTEHDVLPLTEDEALLIDCDLAILGAAEDRYDWFEQAVRKEYQKVPGLLFRRGRRKILQGFLDRPNIFQTAYFQEAYEKRARNNLGRAIKAL